MGRGAHSRSRTGAQRGPAGSSRWVARSASSRMRTRRNRWHGRRCGITSPVAGASWPARESTPPPKGTSTRGLPRSTRISGGCTLVAEMPTRRASSRLDQCVGALRDLFQGAHHHLLHLGIGDGPRDARPGLIAQPVQPGRQEPGPPLGHGGPADAQPRRDRGIAAALGAGQHDPCPQCQPLRGLPPAISCADWQNAQRTWPSSCAH
ncbi:MAG: hypothetical protein JWM19_1518 [Actinomycetia bacterium]|nr:hypothetical protein [Actinomycetes bacterium]